MDWLWERGLVLFFCSSISRGQWGGSDDVLVIGVSIEPSIIYERFVTPGAFPCHLEPGCE